MRLLGSVTDARYSHPRVYSAAFLLFRFARAKGTACLLGILASTLYLNTSPHACAQLTAITSDTSTPLPGTGKDYIQAGGETVNPVDGSLSLRFNVPMPKGRGLNIPFSIAYDSNSTFYAIGLENLVHGSVSGYNGSNVATVNGIFTESLYWTTHSHFLAKAGWSYSAPMASYIVGNQYNQFQTGNYVNTYATQNCIFKTSYIFYDPNGGRHPLGITHSDPADAVIVEGGGGPMSGQGCSTYGRANVPRGGDNYVTSELLPGDPKNMFTVADKDGTAYYYYNLSENLPGMFTDAWIGLPQIIEDRNGNEVTIADQGHGAFTYKDTLGRVILASSGFGDNSDSLTVAGESSPFVVNWQSHAASNFTTNYIPFSSNATQDTQRYCLGFSQTPGTTTGLSRIQLPNGQSFLFSYESTYGLVNQVTYPGGGWVKYTWGTNPLSSFIYYAHMQAHNHWISPTTSSDTASSPNCSALYDKFAIKARDVSYDGSTIALHQTFDYTTETGSLGRWTKKTTTVTTQDQISGQSWTTVYTYLPDQAGEPLESSVVVTQNGTAVQATNKAWYSELHVACEQVSRDGVLSTLTSFAYSQDGRQMTQKNEYASGSCPSTNANPSVDLNGTLLRKTNTAYASFNPVPLLPDLQSIFDKPSSVVVSDASGTTIAETDYAYDQGSVTAVSGTVSHDEDCYGATPTSNCGKISGGSVRPPITAISRANVTSVTQKCLNGCAASTSTFAYDETGQVIAASDPLGHQTAYSYADSPSGGNAAGSSNAYLTKVSRPRVNGVDHVSGYAYNYSTGQMTASTDETNQTTNYSYVDPLNRLTDIYGPASSQNGRQQPHTHVAYVDGPGATVTTTDPDGVVSVVTMDGFGQGVKTQLSSDPSGADTVDTVYNGLGLVASASNPYRATDPAEGSSGSTRGTVHYSYDALGRLRQQQNQDGSLEKWNWQGNATDFYNELGTHWQRTYNTLGELVTVMEPDGNNALAYETDYQYDGLGNLKQVDQWGGPKGSAGDRLRTFSYDSLSRLTGASNPESGTVAYTYDANGNVLTKTDARSVVTHYSYDSLNRLIGKAYTGDPSNTPAVSLYYDAPKAGWLLPAQTYQPNSPSTLLNQIALSNLIGRLSWSTNGTETIVYGYDEAGRPTLKSVCTPSTCPSNDHYDMHAIYDLAGRTIFADLGLDSARNAATPNAGFYYGGLTMAYTNAGKTAGKLVTGTADIVDAAHPANIVSGLQYSPLGGVSSASFGSVYGEGNTFSPRGWTATRFGLIPGFGQRTGTLTHDLVGNVTRVDDSLSGTTQFGVDQLNRLTAASNATSGVAYSYDPWGNLNKHTNTAGQGYTYSLTVTPQNQISQAGSTDPGFVYDASGNVFADGLNNYSYDAEGHLRNVNGATQYLYGPDGTRVATTNNGAVTAEYLYGMDGTLTTTVDASGHLVRGALHGGGMHLADYTAGTGAGGGKTEFHLSDQVGSLVNTIDGTGNVVESCSANPFGENLNCSPSVDFTEVHFTDAKRDQESNLDYFGARYYASIFGRFTSPDPAGIGYADPANPQSLNLYSYAQNNPLTKVDPSGMECVWDDGSYDAADDKDTGSADGCTQQGGTFVSPKLFEKAQLTNGQNASVNYGDWSPNADSTLAQSWTSSSGGTNGGSFMPLSGSVTPRDIGIMTLNQMTAMLKSSNFIYSPFDTALSKLTGSHPGPNFRSSTASCSVHANILPGTGVNGVPARADFHIDLVNPLIPGSAVPEPENAIVHGLIDVISDVAIDEGLIDQAGNRFCNRSGGVD